MQSTSVRGARGVQTDEVWAAADAVLALGERPTIERVRQQLGRGSPNTVGPMLDGWYGSLAGRLQTPDELHTASPQSELALPAPVVRAAKVLWGRALQLSEEQATLQLAQEQEALEIQAQSLRSDQTELVQERQRLDDRADALALAMQAKDAQIAELSRQVQELQHNLGESVERLASAQSENSKARQAIDVERQISAAKDSEHQAERTRMEERTVAQERRLHTEVDRARQEAKRLAQQLESDNKRSMKSLADAIDRENQLGLLVGTLQSDNSSLLRELTAVRDERKGMQLKVDERSNDVLNVLNELRKRLPAANKQRGLIRRKIRVQKRASR